MARRPAGRRRSSGRSSTSRSSKSQSKKKKVFEDDDLIIEDEDEAPKSRKKSRSARSSSSSRGSGSKSSGRRRRSDDDGGGGSGRRGRGRPKKKGGNDDLVVYLLTGIGLLVMITIGLVLMSGGGTEVTNDKEVIKAVKEQLQAADKLFNEYNSAERSKNEGQRAVKIVEAYKAYEKVINKVDSLRKAPYVDSDEMFKPDYEYLEEFQKKAAQNMHDISKRAHTSDNIHGN